MSKEHIARSKGDGEQHCAHPCRLAKQARQTLPDTNSCANSGQQRVAWTGCPGENRRERHERDQPGRVTYNFHASLRRFDLWPPAWVMALPRS